MKTAISLWKTASGLCTAHRQHAVNDLHTILLAVFHNEKARRFPTLPTASTTANTLAFHPYMNGRCEKHRPPEGEGNGFWAQYSLQKQGNVPKILIHARRRSLGIRISIIHPLASLQSHRECKQVPIHFLHATSCPTCVTFRYYLCNL